MSNVVLFRPRENLNAEQQVKEFIATAKTITAFDYYQNASGVQIHYPLKWEAVNWGEWVGVSFVKAGVGAHRVNKNATKPLESDEILSRDLIDFAKAYVLYKQAIKRTKDCKEIKIIRALEPALISLRGKADITLSDQIVFDEAATNLKKMYNSSTANRAGKELERLAKFLNDMKLVPRPLIWENTIKRPAEINQGHRTRKEAAEKKLPKPEALDAIAEIYASKPTAHRDIFTTTSCLIMLCAPSRVGELNEAVKQPFVERQTQEGKTELFVRWFGEKGFGIHEKPIPETMAPLYKQAVSQITEITNDARQLALQLEQNPDEFPIHEDCPKVHQDTILTPTQVLSALSLKGRSPRATLRKWIEAQIIKIESQKDKFPKTWALLNEAYDGLPNLTADSQHVAKDFYSLTLRKLNVILREYLLPSHFPYVSDKHQTKYSDALFCFFQNQLSEDNNAPTRPFNLMVIDSNTLNNDLTPTPKSKANYKNIFTRWGYIGECYKLNTHAFRHYLNTLAQKGAVGQEEIARWSGRMDVNQNAVYNHRTPDDEIKDMKRVGLGAQQTNLAEISRKQIPIKVSEIGGTPGAEDRIAHVTLYGYCEHDFAMEPCTKYRGCIGCKKLKCIKGDEEKQRRIQIERDKIKVNLDKAFRASEEGFYGADRWLKHYMDRYEAANQLLAILNDPNIEEGAVIKATDNGFSPLNHARQLRGESKRSDAPQVASDTSQKEIDFKRLRGLMGR